MAPLEERILTSHFVETASINRQSRKVTRYHDRKGPQCRASRRRRRLGIRLIRPNETMRRIEGEKIVGHIGRNPLVRTRGTHLAGKIGRVRDFT
jgi:hypothetical protein